MRAEIISVGTELLLGQIVDTNAAYLSQILPEFGINLHYRMTVGDNETRLAEALELALSRSDIVFTIGGLGPTQDDLTKETVARVVGDEMIVHEESAQALRDFFGRMGVEMPESNLKQAMIPRRGKVFSNPNGTAPGAAFETDSKVVIVLPGPPREFIPMVNERVTPYLRQRAGKEAGLIKSRLLKVAGLGESSVEDRIKHLLSSTNPTLAPYASPGEVHLRITARADSSEEADRLINGMDATVREILGNCVFGTDRETLEQVVVQTLIERGLTLGTAESCTGGLIASRITDVPGSSAAFLAGIVSYSNEAKVKLLGVPEDLIKEHGAVSEEVARAMAEGIRRVTGADIGISVTGIAGPSGGTPEKPVGLVYMAMSNKDGTVARKDRFVGGRVDIKQRTSQTALNMVRLSLV